MRTPQSESITLELRHPLAYVLGEDSCTSLCSSTNKPSISSGDLQQVRSPRSQRRSKGAACDRVLCWPTCTIEAPASFLSKNDLAESKAFSFSFSFSHHYHRHYTLLIISKLARGFCMLNKPQKSPKTTQTARSDERKYAKIRVKLMIALTYGSAEARVGVAPFFLSRSSRRCCWPAAVLAGVGASPRCCACTTSVCVYERVCVRDQTYRYCCLLPPQ